MISLIYYKIRHLYLPTQQTTSIHLQYIFKTFSRGLQDVLIKTNIFVQVILLQDVFKSFSRLLQGILKWSCQDILKTPSRRLQYVFKTFLRGLQDVLIKTNIFLQVIRLQDIFKTFQDFFNTSSKRLQDVFKTFSRRLDKTFSRCLAKRSLRHP